MKTTTYKNRETGESVEVAQVDPWTSATLDDDGGITEQGKNSKIIGMVNEHGYYSDAQINARQWHKRNNNCLN